MAKGNRSNTTFETYVEYYLEASLVQQNSRGKSSMATMSIQLQPLAPHSPVSIPFKRQCQAGHVSSHRLAPEMRNGISLKHRIHKFLHSSKVPQLSFMVQADCPEIVDLAGPSPLPFRVRLLYNREQTSKTLHDTSQTALITSLELVLKADTYVIAPGNFQFSGPYESSGTVKHRIKLPPLPSKLARSSPLRIASSNSTGDSPSAHQNMEHTTVSDNKVIRSDGDKVQLQVACHTWLEDVAGPPSAGEAARSARNSSRENLWLKIGWVQDDTEFVDVGAALDLRIRQGDAAILGRMIPKAVVHPIYPSFITFCINHTHRLKWKIGLNIGGESFKCKWESPVSVVCSTA